MQHQLGSNMPSFNRLSNSQNAFFGATDHAFSHGPTTTCGHLQAKPLPYIYIYIYIYMFIYLFLFTATQSDHPP